jgi:hypothetical protein
MTYYIWTADGDCQNKTESLEEACNIALDLRDKGAYVADENQQVHRAAWEPAEHKMDKGARFALAASLSCYALPEDIVLTREQFLRTVVSRIEDDLRDNTY